MTDYLEEVIDKKEEVGTICSSIEKNPEVAIFDEIHDIRKWLVEGYTGELDATQITALDQVISDRIRGFIPREKVVELLDLSNNKFGVGLSFRAAQILAEKLELVLEGSLVKSTNIENQKKDNISSENVNDVADSNLKKL